MAIEPADERQHLEERATAFVFGEMSRDDATEFMKKMDSSSDLRSLVNSIREAVGAVEAEFKCDRIGLNQSDLKKVTNAIESKHVEAPPLVQVSEDRSARRWATALAIAATLLLACGLTLPALNQKIISNSKSQKLLEEVRQKERIIERLLNEKAIAQRDLAKLRSAMDGQVVSSDEMVAGTVAGANATPGTESPERLRPKDHFSDGETAITMVPPIDPTQENTTGKDDHPGFTKAPDNRLAIHPGGQPSDRDDAMPDENGGPSETGPQSADPPNAQIAADRTNSGVSEPLDDIAIPRRPKKFDSVGGLTHPVLGQANGRSPAGTPMKQASGFDANPNDAGEDMLAALGGDQATLIEKTRSFGRLGTDDTANMLASGDRFAQINDNPFHTVIDQPLSSFSAKVDSESYSKVRMYLTQYDQLPPSNAVRVEELVNFFDYHYEPPQDDQPFAAAMDVSECPWNPGHRLARVAVKGREIVVNRPASNLVFMIDVSGSMNRPSKLPLVIDGVKSLVDQLGKEDSVAIVVYAGATGIVLDATAGDQKKSIVDALDRLKLGGSTIRGQGIQLAYQLAREHFIDGGINRVVLCSDGNFSVGIAESENLVDIVTENAKNNLLLTVIGFGTSNRNEELLDEIRDKGKGSYAFIDNQNQAHRVLVEELQGTQVTIAKDVRLQVEFNPKQVQAYRLIGYENRMLAAGGLNDDPEDAGEIAAGHTITALYEIVPRAGREGAEQSQPDPLKYQQPIRFSEQASSGELLTLSLTYQLPMENERKSMEFAVSENERSVAMTDGDFQFSAAVAAFGMLLRDSPYRGNVNFEMILELASAGAVDDRSGYRDEFVSLVQRAQQIAGG